MNQELKTFLDNLILDETNNHLGEIEENFLQTEPFAEVPTSMAELEQKYQTLMDEIDEPWWMIWTVVCDMLPEMCAEDEMDEVEIEAKKYLVAEYNKAIIKGLAKHLGL